MSQSSKTGLLINVSLATLYPFAPLFCFNRINILPTTFLSVLSLHNNAFFSSQTRFLRSDVCGISSTSLPAISYPMKTPFSNEILPANNAYDRCIYPS